MLFIIYNLNYVKNSLKKIQILELQPISEGEKNVGNLLATARHELQLSI